MEWAEMLNGTVTLYLTGYNAKPLPGNMAPGPMLSIVVTAMTKPYLNEGTLLQQHRKRNACSHTHLPVHVPSTSVNNFFFTVSRRLGPKYLG